MCDHCGCSDHTHNHDDNNVVHAHSHKHEERTVPVGQPILAQNERLAERTRGFFAGKGITALNIVSSPGSGKTTLLECTIKDLANDIKMAVIVGDLQTENDAVRLKNQGCQAIQITTGTACHLDAHMVQHAMEKLDLTDLKLLFIENVGNLVCPAAFDLGEKTRVVLFSVTEGEDKPLKYPVIFNGADIVVINKMDLAEACDFDRDTAVENIKKVAPNAQIIEVSAKTGENMDAWYGVLKGL